GLLFGLPEMLHHGFYFTKRIFGPELRLDRAEDVAADLFYDGGDPFHFMGGYEFRYVDLTGRDEGGEMAFYGRFREAAARGDLADGYPFLVELKTDTAGLTFGRTGGCGRTVAACIGRPGGC